MILPLSLNRMDRLPLHFSRWNGNISIAVQCHEDEINSLFSIISSIKRENIRFTFYIIKKTKSEKRCSFKMKNGEYFYLYSCYVINELRNLAIETIQTSHFMIIDGDAILSCNISFN